MIRKYPHFNPKKHKIETKIATVKSGLHNKYNINYHIVWIPKYRKQLLAGNVKEILTEIIKGQCSELKCDLLALEIMPDHVHLFVGAKPTHRPSDIIKKLKGNTSRQLRLVFKNLKYLNYPKHYKQFKNLWASGYYCGSAGHISQDAVKRYIEEQEGKDTFEYNMYKQTATIQKGQTKLEDWVA